MTAEDGAGRVTGSLMLFVGALLVFGVAIWARTGSPPVELFLLIGLWLAIAGIIKYGEVVQG